MTLTRSVLGLLLLFCWTVACDLEEEPAASYLYIQPFQFAIRPGEGTAHHKVSDAWVFVNGEFAGAYELPVWLPVLAKGPSDILILPGFRINGSITNNARFQLAENFSVNVDLTPEETDTIRPVTAYQSGLVFPFVEDFEGNHFLSNDRDGDAETNILLSNTTEAFEGQNSGVIELTAQHPRLVAEYLIEQAIPKSADPILLELSFKSDIPFSIGFFGYNDQLGQENLLYGTVLPKQDWTKIYFDFREIINQSNSQKFRLALSAGFNADTAKTVQRILIDNFKVVHR
ncbi:MAG TPA: hypothetical protein VFX48_03160 [Saprospiraceae bacterium]|nr:hypothetical protein [Saprospiraceae bacterium]